MEKKDQKKALQYKYIDAKSTLQIEYGGNTKSHKGLSRVFPDYRII